MSGFAAVLNGFDESISGVASEVFTGRNYNNIMFVCVAQEKRNRYLVSDSLGTIMLFIA